MLSSLEIRDLLIIDRLTLEFQPGLNVLTGETGAGKSILLDALGFVLGWRGRAELVRSGADQGEVVAVFEVSPGHPANDVLSEAGLDVGEDGEIVLRRINKSDGRKTAWINDRRASGEVLRKLSETLVELHGQNDESGLLNVANHRRLLDDFADLQARVSECRSAWSARTAAFRALKKEEELQAAAREEEDYLRHAVGELEELSPQPGEEDQLDSQRRLMQAASKIGDDIARADAALGMDGAENMMANAMRWLEGVSDKAEGGLDEAIEALGRALNELGHAQSEIETAREAMAFDPTTLERVEERLFALRALARKHGVGVDALPEIRAKLAADLETLDSSAERIDRLTEEANKADASWRNQATLLSKARVKAATDLAEAMMAELAPLKLERAVFEVLCERGDDGPDGFDRVEFRVATNPGAPSGALNKIASGGELSRFMLALKVCLAREGGGQTMIFDEIDRGVGGATADAVGARLADLASDAQVLVVTHSPQVAAKSTHHWRVSKDVKDGQTLSTVAPLDQVERIDEIARMLSGDHVTDEARAAARALVSPG